MKKIFLIFMCVAYWQTSAVAGNEIALPEIGDSAGSLISPQQEYAIGLSYYWQLQRKYDLIDDPEINTYLSQLGARLVANSDAPQLPFHFFMLPESSVNAFAAPGGFIGVHTGLFLTAQTEDEVASVLAHEIAHITQRHLLRSFEQQQQMSVPMTVAMIAAALLGVADPKAGSAALMAVQAGGVQSRINFTRTNEAEADNLGMLTLVRSGFDAQAMPAFFERLQQTSRFYSTDAVPDFLRTHPVTTERIADARGRAVTYPLQPQLGDSLQFYLMREKARVLTTDNLDQLIRYYDDALKEGNGANPDAIRYGYSLALLAAGKTTTARQVLQPLLDKDAERLSYQLALADIEVAVGRLSTALAIYERYQRLYPDDRALTLQQVNALIQANEPKKATDLLLRQLEIGNSSRTLFQQLARTTGDMGQKSESHIWLAEYYYASGRLNQAADQLRIAADYAVGDQFQLAKVSSRLRDIELVLAQMEK